MLLIFEELLGSRIYNGTKAQQGELPYQVFMTWNGQFRCGGVLIDDHWVLTAAHCLNPYGSSLPSGSIGVKAGSVLRNDDPMKLQTRSIPHDTDHIIIHKNWFPKNPRVDANGMSPVTMVYIKLKYE